MNPAIQEFKAQLIPKVPDFFYDINRQRYLMKQSAGKNQREWVPLNETQASRVLMLAGVRGVKAKSEDLSPTMRMLCDATMSSEHTVHYSGPLAGYHEGLVCTGGVRMLVTVGPRIIKPEKGSWDTIRTVIEGLLGERDGVQLAYIYAWLSLSYTALRTGDTRGMPAVVICGPKDCGKTFIQQHLITPILGGRVARPYPYMSGATQFNAELFGAEHLAMGDESPSTNLTARRKFGAQIKTFVAEEHQYMHDKFCTARTMRPFWRLTISLNDEPENVLTLPPFEDSIEDKLMLLHAQRFSWPMRLVTPQEKKAFAKQFALEIPAFLHWLTKEFKMPDHVTHPRWTVAAYHSPRLLNGLTEVSPECRLLELIRMCYFEAPDKKAGDIPGGLVITALGLEQGLIADASPVRYEARQLLSGGGRKVSAFLRRLETRFPDSIYQTRTAKERQWHLQNLSGVLASISGEQYE